MTAPSDTTVDLHAIIAKLRSERDAALTRETTLTEALARRDTQYSERMEHQSATIDVLKAMSASPGDPQPVFELIASRARDLCDAYGLTVYEFDGTLIHWRASTGVSDDESVRRAVEAMYPMAPSRSWGVGRAILDRQIIHIHDLETEPGLTPALRTITAKSQAVVPLTRGDATIGALALGSRQRRGFLGSQIELLKTFAEQAAIAMMTAETYPALQTRTADLQESLEYQTAISDVLKIISRSPSDLQSILANVAETAARLCGAEQAAIFRRERESVWLAANFGFPPEYEAASRSLGTIPLGHHTTTVGHRASVERRPVHIHDVAAVPGYWDVAIKLGKQRTSLAVPFLRGADVVGHIVLARQRVEPFTERQIELVSTFADQAVIAIENARLLTEQREALEQQTATAEVLGVINASPGNLAPVFDAMLEKAMRLCGAAFGEFHRFDGEHFVPVALVGLPAAYAEFRLRTPPIYGPGTLAWRVRGGAEVLHITDLMDEDVYRDGDPQRRAMVDLGGARSGVSVALRRDGNLLGMINIYRQEVRPFGERQVALLKNFAAQAVIAMENVRLLTEQREALQQQTATAEVLQVINANPGNLAPVFATIVEKAHATCGADMGSLQIWDGTHVRALATLGYPAEVDAMLRRPFPPGPNQLGMLAGDRLSHRTDATLAPNPDNISQGFRERSGIRTNLQVPMRKDGAVVGFITANRREVRPFSDKEISLLENFAAQAVIAMENARLLNEVRQRQEELRITFENMGDGVAMFAEHQRLVAWNSKFQEIFDLPESLLEEHRTYEEHLRFLAERGDFGAGVDSADQIRYLVASTGQPYAYERTRPDGRIIEIRRNPVPDGGFVLIFSDITERKRSEAQIRDARDAAEEASRTIEAAYRDLKAAQANLIQAEKMASLGQLTAGIAHEIKNSLNFVNNFAELSGDLLDELNDAIAGNRQAEIDELRATLQGNLAKITEHGKRADDIVKAMLEHSRGSSGERRKVDINTLIDEALNLAYHGARAQDQSFNITLERDFAEGISPIELAPQDITRVFLNLFSNGFYAVTRRARQGAGAGFMPALKVATRDAGEAVEVRVWDNGIGISADIRDKLFQPFFTTKPTGEGTGLGLSISYDIVTQQHSGSITVDSEVGEYSEFTIQLPRR